MLRAMWFLSVLVVLANLLFVYASLPEQVIILEEAAGKISLNRELVFYILMVSIVIINAMVYLFKKMFPEAENLRAWFHGLVVTINIFFVVSMHAINVYNSTETFDHSRVGFFIYGSLALILLWATIWPVYFIYQKFFLKQII
jgi:hypothetical protein